MLISGPNPVKRQKSLRQVLMFAARESSAGNLDLQFYIKCVMCAYICMYFNGFNT